MGFFGGSDSKESACNAGDPASIPGSGRFPWRTQLANRSSSLAWRMLWTEEPGGLQSITSPRVRQDWVNNTFSFLACTIDNAPRMCRYRRGMERLESPRMWYEVTWDRTRQGHTGTQNHMEQDHRGPSSGPGSAVCGWHRVGPQLSLLFLGPL